MFNFFNEISPINAHRFRIVTELILSKVWTCEPFRRNDSDQNLADPLEAKRRALKIVLLAEILKSAI